MLAGPPDAVLGLLAGYVDGPAAAELGVEIVGDARRLRRLRPTLAQPTPDPRPVGSIRCEPGFTTA